MRKIINSQLELGEVDISQINFDLQSRDEIPKILLGLQHLYINLSTREEIFKILESLIPPDTRKNDGRPGMNLWNIFVLALLRLNCRWDYDKLCEMANEHRTIRLMLGHGTLSSESYALQTLKDNIVLFTPEILDSINQIAVKAGHNLLPQSETAELKGQCDSFVLETNVHYPTDSNVLFDSARRAVCLVAQLCMILGISGWREWKSHLLKIKRLFNGTRKLRKSTSKDDAQIAQREAEIKSRFESYIGYIEGVLPNIENSLSQITEMVESKTRFIPQRCFKKIEQLQGFITHSKALIDQLRRRVLNGEKIPHGEKIFSVFQEHTEWICKGKAGVLQELGVRVCILKDQFGFILHHMVMEKQTDDKVTLPMVQGALKRFCNLIGCSFDKGFYSPSNRQELDEILAKVVLPKKGKLSRADKEREHDKDFIKDKRIHPAVESSINALENHGLDRCPDHGIDGFKRYVALSVTARNIQMLGHIVQQQKRFHKIRQEKAISSHLAQAS